MKSALFIIPAFLISGFVSAQQAGVKTTASVNAGAGSASAQTDIKTSGIKEKSAEAAGKVKTAATAQYQSAKGDVAAVKQTGKTSVNATAASNVSTTINKTNAGISSESNTAIAANTNAVSNTTKGVKTTATVAGNDVKQSAGTVKTTVKAKTKIATASTIKPAPIKTTAGLKTNMKLGIR